MDTLKVIYWKIRDKAPWFFFLSYIRRNFRNWHFNKYLGRIDIIPEHVTGRYSDIFRSHSGLNSQKWLQYLEIYDELAEEVIKKFGDKVSILEIGVQSGGSIQIWRKLFGPKARIVGIDINPACAALELDAEICIGNARSEQFLSSLISNDTPFDVVVDDGSHDSRDQKTTFEFLFPHLSENGIYIIEDLEHSYYWSKRGGYHRKNSFVEQLKQTIDQMHKNFYLMPARKGFNIDIASLKSITIFMGIVVIRKGLPLEPRIVETRALHS